jgi:hypothetical protein
LGLRSTLEQLEDAQLVRRDTAQAREHLDFIIARTLQEFRASFLNSPNVRKVAET